jgi:RimJ/RimL family protein N-acetyltransferase
MLRKHKSFSKSVKSEILCVKSAGCRFRIAALLVPEGFKDLEKAFPVDTAESRLSLRPVEDGDFIRLLDWRNSDRIRSVSVNQQTIANGTHREWLSQKIQSQPKHVLIVEWDLRPVGVVQVDKWVDGGRFGEWGCYLGETDVPPGLGASLPLLALGYAFIHLKASKMRALVLDTNRNMISIHKRLGLVPESSNVSEIGSDLRPPDSFFQYEVHDSDWELILKNGLSLFSAEIRRSIEACLLQWK